MICPLIAITAKKTYPECQRGICAWWLEADAMCAIKSIAYNFLPMSVAIGTIGEIVVDNNKDEQNAKNL